MSAEHAIPLLRCTLYDLGELILTLTPGARRMRPGVDGNDMPAHIAAELARDDKAPQHRIADRTVLIESPRLGLFIVEELDGPVPAFVVLTPEEAPVYIAAGRSLFIEAHRTINLDAWCAAARARLDRRARA